MIGQRVKHYEIQETLGKGGMGVVYRAQDTRLGRPVALKFLPAEFTSDPDRKRRFLQEARAASAVNHPAIAQVYDVDEADDGVFIAMELVPGKTVRGLLKGRELDLLGALEIGQQVAGGLAKAHEAGIVHRDIKPENVIVTPDGHAKILDFGLAKLMEAGSDPAAAPSGDELSHMETVAKTQAGLVLGTLKYMSPEQARGRAVDHRSDIFSLGVVVYEMVTGQLPFSGVTALDTLHAIAFEETRPITTVRAHLPPSLQRVVTRCLRKRPEDRFRDAKELASELKTVQREVESGISSKVTLRERIEERLRSLRELTPRDWIWAGGIAAAGLVLLALLLRGGEAIPSLLMFGFFGLLLYRRIRNRRYRFMKRFSGKLQKMPEVRVIATDGQRVTVVADKALARTYVRANALIDQINAKLFFGDPFSVVVRDDLSEEELKRLLSSPGVVYVREEPHEDG